MIPVWLAITIILIAVFATAGTIAALARAGRLLVDADFAPPAPACPPGDIQ